MKQIIAAGMALLVALAPLTQADAQRPRIGQGGLGDRAPPRGGMSYNPKDTRDPFSRGIAALDQGDYALARNMFEEVLSDEPDDANALVLLGMSFMGLNDARAARRKLEQAVRLDRANVDGHRELGLATARLGDAKAAEKELKWLTARLAACPAKCEDPAKLQRAVDAVQAALAPPKAG
jgi:Flp pilus assembly protein TadD